MLIGYEVRHYKWLAFVLSGAVAGLAGGVYAITHAQVNAQLFDVTVSVDAVIWTLIGGAGSVLGPAVGAALVLAFTHIVSGWMVYTQIPVGILLILIVLFFPRGLAGVWRAWQSRRASRVSQIALETRRLTRQFGGLMAVDGVDLAIHDGELRALIGPNGAGKTTCINLLSGLLPPSGGEIRWEGTDVTRLVGGAAGPGGHRADDAGHEHLPEPHRVRERLAGRPAAARAALGRPGAGRVPGGRRARARVPGARRHRRAGRTSPRAASGTATSGCSRSPSRSPCGRGSSCSTSRPPA